jgi:hypothetical protein
MKFIFSIPQEDNYVIIHLKEFDSEYKTAELFFHVLSWIISKQIILEIFLQWPDKATLDLYIFLYTFKIIFIFRIKYYSYGTSKISFLISHVTTIYINNHYPKLMF